MDYTSFLSFFWIRFVDFHHNILHLQRFQLCANLEQVFLPNFFCLDVSNCYSTKDRFYLLRPISHLHRRYHPIRNLIRISYQWYVRRWHTTRKPFSNRCFFWILWYFLIYTWPSWSMGNLVHVKHNNLFLVMCHEDVFCNELRELQLLRKFL